MPACLTCQSPNATLRCSGCSSHLPPQKIVHYCDKTCQKADWPYHKQVCLLARFYTRVRGIFLEHSKPAKHSIEEWRAAMKEFKGLSVDFIEDMRCYIECVEVERRPLLVASDKSRIRDLGEFLGSADEYMIAWERDVIPRIDLLELCRTEDEWRVAGDKRPIMNVVDMQGNKRPAIQCYPQDFDVLSFIDYSHMFGEGKKLWYDAWVNLGVPKGSKDEIEDLFVGVEDRE